MRTKSAVDPSISNTRNSLPQSSHRLNRYLPPKTNCLHSVLFHLLQHTNLAYLHHVSIIFFPI